MTWCVYCRSPIPDDAQQCPSCGKTLSDGTKVIQCPACKKYILKNAAQCKFCGTPMKDETPAETPPVPPQPAVQVPAEPEPVSEPPAPPEPPRPAQPAEPPKPEQSPEQPPSPAEQPAKTQKTAAKRKGKAKKKSIPVPAVLVLAVVVVAAILLLHPGREKAVSEEDAKAFMSSCDSVAYALVTHDPQRYAGKHITFSGKVLQVLEGGTVYLHMTQVNPVLLSDSDVWQASYTLRENEPPFEEGAELTVYGECMGAGSYRGADGETVTMPVIRVVCWEEADLARLSAGQDPVFSLGETWTIDGLCSLTVKDVKRLKSDDPDDPAVKYLVEYSYTNLGYQSETAEGILVTIDEIILDSAGMMGRRFPWEVKNLPYVTPVGETCNAEACIGLEHVGSFQLTVNIYDAAFNTHTARFNLSES